MALSPGDLRPGLFIAKFRLRRKPRSGQSDSAINREALCGCVQEGCREDLCQFVYSEWRL